MRQVSFAQDFPQGEYKARCWGHIQHLDTRDLQLSFSVISQTTISRLAPSHSRWRRHRGSGSLAWPNLDMVCFCRQEDNDRCRVCLSWRLCCTVVVVSRVTLGCIITPAARAESIWWFFWHSLQGPVIGGQAYRIPPVTSAAWEEKKILFDEKTRRIATNAELSERAKNTQGHTSCGSSGSPLWMMDSTWKMPSKRRPSSPVPLLWWIRQEVGKREIGWDPDSQWACGYIFKYTKAVKCNGQSHMQNYRLLKFRSIMEAVSWVFDDVLDEHVWVSELTISCQEAEVLEPPTVRPGKSMHCPVENAMVLGTHKPQPWTTEECSDPRDTMKRSIWLFLATFTLPSCTMHIPRSCFLRSIRTVLTNTLERVWNLDVDMRGYGLGERLDLLFDMETVTTTWILMKNGLGELRNGWVEHLVNHRSHCESPWLAEKEATFLLGLAREGRWPRLSEVIQGGTPPRRVSWKSRADPSALCFFLVSRVGPIRTSVNEYCPAEGQRVLYGERQIKGPQWENKNVNIWRMSRGSL